MRAVITLGGGGVYADDNLALQDTLADILTETYRDIGFSIIDRERISAEFSDVSKAEDVLECVLDEWARPDAVGDFMKTNNLRFRKVEFDAEDEEDQKHTYVTAGEFEELAGQDPKPVVVIRSSGAECGVVSVCTGIPCTFLEIAGKESIAEKGNVFLDSKELLDSLKEHYAAKNDLLGVFFETTPNKEYYADKIELIGGVIKIYEGDKRV